MARPVQDLTSELAELAHNSGDGYEEEVGTFLWRGVRLLRVTVRPTGKARPASLLISHSLFELSKLQRSEIALARAAAAAGFTAVYVQAPGAGDSEGLPEEAKVLDRVALASDVAAAMVGDAPEDHAVCFMGARYGGAVAARAALDHAGPRALVVWDPAFERDRYWSQLKRLARVTAVTGGHRSYVDPDVLLQDGCEIALFGVKVDASVAEDLRSLDDSISGGGFDGPVLGVLTGQAPPPAGLENLSPDVEMVKVGPPRSLHLGVREAREAVEPTVSWMARKLP